MNYDVIIIGAGHAGITLSYYLKKLQINHAVFEKGRIGDTWRNQRWDSFRLNTPVGFSQLPGAENRIVDNEGFWTAGEFVSHLENYVKTFQLPVFELCDVLSVERAPDTGLFCVTVSSEGSVIKYISKKVAVASGSQNRKWVPAFSGNLSEEIFQIHAAEYKNPSLLPEGAVMVVGSAQSGVQIAEDLIDSGKEVFISTSQVGRVPRRYRGKDIVDWLMLAGFYDILRSEVSDPAVIKARFPQISGVGRHGHTLSLQSLAKKGAVILGKAIDADSGTLFIQPDAISNIKFADESSARTKALIDQFILNSGSTALKPEVDFADIPCEPGTIASGETRIDIKKREITSIIWTTGFRGDYRYLKMPVFDTLGDIAHREGKSDIEGLYFLGLPWMRKRKSGIIFGIREDAEFIAGQLLTK